MNNPLIFPRLDAIWWNGQDFLQHVKKIDNNISFFYQVAQLSKLSNITKGTIVELSVQFLDEDVNFHLHAHIHDIIDEDQAQGFILVCQADELHRQKMLLECAHGRSVSYEKRQHERLSCILPLNIQHPDAHVMQSWALNISALGTFIPYDEKLHTNMHLKLNLEFPHETESYTVACTVKERINTAYRDGFGLQFDFDSEEEKYRLSHSIESFHLHYMESAG